MSRTYRVTVTEFVPVEDPRDLLCEDWDEVPLVIKVSILAELANRCIDIPPWGDSAISHLDQGSLVTVEEVEDS